MGCHSLIGSWLEERGLVLQSNYSYERRHVLGLWTVLATWVVQRALKYWNMAFTALCPWWRMEHVSNRLPPPLPPLPQDRCCPWLQGSNQQAQVQLANILQTDLPRPVLILGILHMLCNWFNVKLYPACFTFEAQKHHWISRGRKRRGNILTRERSENSTANSTLWCTTTLILGKQGGKIYSLFSSKCLKL